MRLKFPSSARVLLESWTHIDSLTSAEFVANDFDYLAEHQDIDLEQVASDANAVYKQRKPSISVTSHDYWTDP